MKIHWKHVNEFQDRQNVLEIAYEELISTREVVDHLCGFLELNDSSHEGLLNSYTQIIRDDKTPDWKRGLESEAIELIEEHLVRN